ncbi:hypothetical protein SZMC14600_18644 [Saccharomonospora azurea SZMC 14600]|nr:hypothetical protein SZMC14600_18644 [Saccharomonospora azurea SZMC 14600]
MHQHRARLCGHRQFHRAPRVPHPHRQQDVTDRSRAVRRVVHDDAVQIGAARRHGRQRDDAVSTEDVDEPIQCHHGRECSP